MQIEELNKEREGHLKEMKSAGEKLKAMIIRTNGKYNIGDTFRCENIIDDNEIQVIDAHTINTSMMPKHCHPISSEYIVVVKGSLEIKTNKKKYILSRGEYLVLKCGEEHSSKPLTKDTRTITLLIPPEKAYRR